MAAGEPQALATVASALVAVFWLLYCLFNTVFPGPPTLLGPITPINLLYVLMVLALVPMLLHALRSSTAGMREVAFPGWMPYLAFMAWAGASLFWHAAQPPNALLKEFIVFGLLGLVALQGAQFQASRQVDMFALACVATTAILTVWTVWHAVSSGFAYRAGVPVNPNFVATLIGPGLMFAIARFLSGSQGSAWRWVHFLVGMGALYSLLLLGSRGVIVAAGAAGAVLLSRTPFKWPQLGIVAAGSALVLLLSTVNFSNPVEPPSTAITRFVEEETTTLNLRLDPWAEGAAFLTSGAKNALIGGGMGMSRIVAHEANPVFDNIHNLFLQVSVDYGVVGLALFLGFHGLIAVSLLRQRHWANAALLSGMAFFLFVGLTATVDDLHVYWAFLGMAAWAGRDSGRTAI